MKKTLRKILIFCITIALIAIPCGKVNAYSVELDPNSLITFPMILVDGKGEVSISDSETGYTLYYQSIPMTDEETTKLKDLNYEGNDLKLDIDHLDQRLDSLKISAKDALDRYNQKVADGVTGAELETAKTASETAEANYQAELSQYDSKVAAIREQMTANDNKIKELTPTYSDDGWTKTEDKNFTIDLDKFSGKRAVAAWIKLVSSNGDVSYDEATYYIQGTMADDDNDEPANTIDQNDAENTLVIGGTNTVTPDNTVANTKLPQTGATAIIPVCFMGIIGLALISRKKFNKFRDIK